MLHCFQCNEIERGCLFRAQILDVICFLSYTCNVGFDTLKSLA